MGRWLVRLAGVVAIATAGIAAVFLTGMRSGSPVVVDRVRRFNRAVTNPRVLRTAGAPGSSAAVLRHVGRSSGRPYATPVGPFLVEDDVVIALPYGPGADWVRNVLASGAATLVHEGATLRLHRPEVVPIATVLGDLPPAERRTLRLFGVDEGLRLAVVAGDPPTG